MIRSSADTVASHDETPKRLIDLVPSRVHESRTQWLQREVRTHLMNNGSLNCLFADTSDKDLLIDATIMETLDAVVRVCRATIGNDRLRDLSADEAIEFVSDSLRETARLVGHVESLT